VRTFWLDKEYINCQIAKAVDALRADQNVQRIVLFGSFAEDRAVPGSDVDILIITKVDSRRFIDRILFYLEAFSEIGIGVDVFPYTVDELDNPVAVTAIRTGRVLFERGN
jgi:predicted nucleotidyltransferase